MCHTLIQSTNFFELLFTIDQSVAESARDLGCQFCGGALHKADYERKPRGLDGLRRCREWRLRFSYCCGTDGCRKRHTPPSLRFLGARVYLGLVVVLATALQQGLTPKREARLLKQIPRQTLYRWLTWWREQFPQSTVWQRLKAYYSLATPLPLAWLEAIRADTLSDRMTILLRQTSQLLTTWASELMEVIVPQKL